MIIKSIIYDDIEDIYIVELNKKILLWNNINGYIVSSNNKFSNISINL